MIKKSRVVLSWGLAPLLAGTLMTGGMAQDAETAKIIEEIESIQKMLEDGTDRNNARALTAIRAALASPKATYDFYMESLKQIDFDEEGRREADWREWRDANEERLKESEHVKALQLQLKFLALSVKASGGNADDDTLKTVMPDLIAFMDTMTSAAEEIEDHRRVLERSVLETQIGKRLKLNLTVGKGMPWSYSPMNVSEVYEKTVMPYYRRARDARGLASAWDRRIVHEAKVAALPELGGGGGRGRRGESDRDREREERREEERTSQRGEEVFREERLPELQWGKTKDALLYGSDRIAALRAMTRIVKDNLAHEKAPGWLAEVAGLAKTKTYELVPTSAEVEAGVTESGDSSVPAIPELPDPPTAEVDESDFQVK